MQKGIVGLSFFSSFLPFIFIPLQASPEVEVGALFDKLKHAVEQLEIGMKLGFDLCFLG